METHVMWPVHHICWICKEHLCLQSRKQTQTGNDSNMNSLSASETALDRGKMKVCPGASTGLVTSSKRVWKVWLSTEIRNLKEWIWDWDTKMPNSRAQHKEGAETSQEGSQSQGRRSRKDLKQSYPIPTSWWTTVQQLDNSRTIVG